MLLLDEVMAERFRDLLVANTGLAAAFHYARSRPPLSTLPLFSPLGADADALLLRRAPGGGGAAADGNAGAGAPAVWRVFFPGQTIARLGAPIEHVVVIAKGSVRMRFPAAAAAPASPPGDAGKEHHHEQQGKEGAEEEDHVVVASVGDPLFVCELMLGAPRAASELTADSMVQALLLPAARFRRLADAEPGVAEAARRAAAAQLAAQHHNILGVHRQLAPLNMFFRTCQVQRRAPGEALAVPRTALLVTGRVERVHRGGAAVAALSRGSSPPRIGGGAAVAAAIEAAAGGESPKAAAAGALPPLPPPASPPLPPLAPSPPPPPARGARRAFKAPAELPPGDYECAAAAVLLQVPADHRMPSAAETAAYQAHVLGKGSIPALPRAHSASLDDAPRGGGSTPPPALAARSTPLRGLLSTISRGLSGAYGDGGALDWPSVGGAGAGAQEGRFLKRALAAMRAERPREAAAGAADGAGAPRAARGGVELSGVGAAAAAPAARDPDSVASTASAASGGGGPAAAMVRRLATRLRGGRGGAAAGAAGGVGGGSGDGADSPVAAASRRSLLADGGALAPRGSFGSRRSLN